MEAPERIYFGEADKSVLDIYSTKEHDDEVEYVRKDVFVEKACNAYCKVCKVPNCRSNECKMIEDFKKYIEE
jgi:hypothetical protein